jgi:hypothetical protein
VNNNHHYDDEAYDYLIGALVILLIIVCVWCSGCYQATANSPDVDQFAAQCNAGLPASCMAMQAIYSNAQTQAQIDDSDALAAHARWQNYWLTQQQTWNSINTDNSLMLQNSLNRLQLR